MPQLSKHQCERTSQRRKLEMDTATTEARTEAAPAQTAAPQAPEPPPEAPKPLAEAPKSRAPVSERIPAIIVAVVVGAVATLSIWYLVRGQPLLVQGEVDATRLDIAARVDGRVGDVPAVRGQNV